MEINKELFKKYAEIKAEIKRLEEEAKMIAPTIMEMVDSTDEKRIESDFGKFSVTTKKTWKYSEIVNDMAAKLKIQQDNEVATGKATFTESRSVRFDSIKSEE